MVFGNNDYLRVIKHLGLLIAQSQLVKDALVAAAVDSDLESEIITTLDGLDSIVAALNQERSSANAALIKADVLEWSPGQRTSGMNQTRFELQQQLANLLGLEWSNSRSNDSGSLEIKVF